MKKVKLNLSIDEAKLLHNGASQERKLELEELFPELNPKDIRDRVKTYEDALEVLRRDHFDEKNLYPREIARRKLEIIIEALNESWKPDWEDYCQLKWYPNFNGSSVGLRYSTSYRSPASVTVNFGVRLCCKSKEIADYVGQQFFPFFREMFLG